MTSGSEIEPVSGAPAPVASAAPKTTRPAKRHWTRRRGLAGGFAAFGVVALAAAVVAPTGMALAEQPEADVETAFSLAVQDTQDLKVSVSGATIAPVDRGSFEVYVTPTPTPTPEPEPASSDEAGDESSGGGGPLFYTGGGAPAEWMAAAGIASSDWGYVHYIVSKESGWNPNAINSSSGACGLIQIMPLHGIEDCHDPVVNLRWGNGYATGRYGSWAGAYDFWINNHWW